MAVTSMDGKESSRKVTATYYTLKLDFDIIFPGERFEYSACSTQCKELVRWGGSLKQDGVKLGWSVDGCDKVEDQ